MDLCCKGMVFKDFGDLGPSYDDPPIQYWVGDSGLSSVRSPMSLVAGFVGEPIDEVYCSCFE